jgi:molecular chaperone GrpE
VAFDLNEGRGNASDPITSPTASAPRREAKGGGLESAPIPPGRDDPAPETSAVSISASLEIENLHKKLAEKDAQIAKVMEAYKAVKKETEKSRHRIEQNLRRSFEQSKNDFIGQFVEVLDNIDRAIEAVENNFDSDSVLQGIILLRSRLVQVLRGEGLEKIFVDGQPFDPSHSEAAAIEPVDDQSNDNMVIRELQRGYMLKGSLLRPARVVVGRLEGPRGMNGQKPGPERDGGG